MSLMKHKNKVFIRFFSGQKLSQFKRFTDKSMIDTDNFS